MAYLVAQVPFIYLILYLVYIRWDGVTCLFFLFSAIPLSKF